MSISSGQGDAYWFLRGARGIASLPAIILMSAFVGFCGFAVEAGIPLGETVIDYWQSSGRRSICRCGHGSLRWRPGLPWMFPRYR